MIFAVSLISKIITHTEKSPAHMIDLYNIYVSYKKYRCNDIYFKI